MTNTVELAKDHRSVGQLPHSLQRLIEQLAQTSHLTLEVVYLSSTLSFTNYYSAGFPAVRLK